MRHTRVCVKEIFPHEGKNIYGAHECVSIGDIFFYLWDNSLSTAAGIMLGLSTMLPDTPHRGRHNALYAHLRLENTHEGLPLPDFRSRSFPRRCHRREASTRGPEAGYRNAFERNAYADLQSWTNRLSRHQIHDLAVSQRQRGCHAR
jgi:hypothetical protein